MIWLLFVAMLCVVAPPMWLVWLLTCRVQRLEEWRRSMEVRDE